VRIDGGVQTSKGGVRRIMENKGRLTCAGCKNQLERVRKGCTVTTEKFCIFGIEGVGACSKYKPRFEKKQKIKPMEDYLL
jgi:hypothetical protein